MTPTTRERPLSEQAFAALVEDLVARGARGDLADAGDARKRLVDLLRENHPVYAERDSEAAVRMRGWVLLALEHMGVGEAELIFVLEELDSGRDPYLIAAAAHVLRTCLDPSPTFVDVVEEAIQRVRYRDDTVNLRQYGGYGAADVDTTACRELERTLSWLRQVTPSTRTARRGVSAPLAQQASLPPIYKESLM